MTTPNAAVLSYMLYCILSNPMAANVTRLRNAAGIACAVAVGITFANLLIIHKDSVFHLAWSHFKVAPPYWLVDDATFAFELGNSRFSDAEQGMYDLTMAEHYYARALEINPRFKDPLFQLGRIDFINGEFFSAIEKFSMVLGSIPDPVVHRSTYYMRALAYGYVRRFSDAVRDFETIIEAEGNSEWGALWAARADLGWVYFQQGDFEAVLRISDEGLVTAPNNPWLLTNKGVALLNLGEKEEAHVTLERASHEAQQLTEEGWARAYPGNDPLEAYLGLDAMIDTIDTNLALTVDN